MRLKNILAMLTFLAVGLQSNATAQKVALQPYVGGGVVTSLYGEFSPCRCTTVSVDVSGGLLLGNWGRVGLGTGTFAVGDGQVLKLGVEGGVRLLPLKRSKAQVRRLELRAGLSSLLYDNYVDENDRSHRRGGYAHTIDVLWRFRARKEQAPGWYLLAGRSTVVKISGLSSGEFPLSKTRETNVGWRFGFGYSL